MIMDEIGPVDGFGKEAQDQCLVFGILLRRRRERRLELGEYTEEGLPKPFVPFLFVAFYKLQGIR